MAGDLKAVMIMYQWSLKDVELNIWKDLGSGVSALKLMVASFLKTGGWPTATKRP